MQERNLKVDLYLEEGCGRCARYQTPNCKVHKWQNELVALREIALECGLKEELKWSYPCYTHNGKNIFMIGSLKDYATLSFFKGVLLKDEYKILTKPGKNSQSYKLLKVSDFRELLKIKDIVKAYIFEAIDNEEVGKKVIFKKNPETMPEEFLQFFEKMPELKFAFENLTPGRKRSYILHISDAKQEKTRISRIEKCIPKILNGKGFLE